MLSCNAISLALWALVALAATVASGSGEDQCDASQPAGICREGRDSHLARYEKFEDIPEEMIQRGHMKELGAHREPDGEVDVLPYMISSEDFYESYVSRHKPVVIKNVAKYWPATTLWTDEYLKKKYGDVTLNMETRDDDKWRIPPSRKLGQFLDVYEEANLYLVDELPPGMRKDVNMPLCLRCNEIANRFFVSYFWMSTGGTSSKLHIDTDENLLTVVNGYKDIVLISPKYSRDVYADEARMLGVSEVNVSAVDFHEFPRVANIRYMVARLKAGDALYLPQMWWHYVYSGRTRQQAVAMWWKSIPYQKGFAKKSASTSRLRTAEELAADTRNTSLARWLEEYIWWIDDMKVEANTRPVCENQFKAMLDYPFETDKDQWRDQLTEGRAMTDNPDEDMNINHGCYFDVKNLESPCHAPVCAGGLSTKSGSLSERESPGASDEEEEEDEELAQQNEVLCIRYTLDYCSKYEDRGCVIELPQSLNKKSADEVKQISAMKKNL